MGGSIASMGPVVLVVVLVGYPAAMHCALCKEAMSYIHGHAACVRNGCPMYGVNQAECCSGETAACGPLTAEVAWAHDPRRDPRIRQA